MLQEDMYLFDFVKLGTLLLHLLTELIYLFLLRLPSQVTLKSTSGNLSNLGQSL
jgi:hypothetical protein